MPNQEQTKSNVFRHIALFFRDAAVSFVVNFRIFKMNLLVGFLFFLFIPVTAWPGFPLSGVLGNLFHDYSTIGNGAWFGFALYAAVLAVMSSTCLGMRSERDWLRMKRLQHNPEDSDPNEGLPADITAGDWLCFPVPLKTFFLFSLCIWPAPQNLVHEL